MTDWQMSIKRVIFAEKNGWRAMAMHASRAGKAEAMPIAKPGKESANKIPRSAILVYKACSTVSGAKYHHKSNRQTQNRGSID